MPHNIIKKIPAFQYGKQQEEKQSKTEQGRELLSKTKTFKGKLKFLKEGLKKKILRYDE